MENNVISILKFNLDTPDGQIAHVRACKATKAYHSLYEIQELLRHYTKYTDLEEATLELLSKIRLEVSVIISENDINLSSEYS